MATGLIALAVVLRAEKARQAFYGEDERGGLALAVLVALPVAALLFGVLWWVMGKLFPLPQMPVAQTLRKQAICNPMCHQDAIWK